jgi:hypothetical protein
MPYFAEKTQASQERGTRFNLIFPFFILTGLPSQNQFLELISKVVILILVGSNSPTLGAALISFLGFVLSLIPRCLRRGSSLNSGVRRQNSESEFNSNSNFF